MRITSGFREVSNEVRNLGNNREIAWRFSVATDFPSKSLLVSFPIRKCGKPASAESGKRAFYLMSECDTSRTRIKGDNFNLAKPKALLKTYLGVPKNYLNILLIAEIIASINSAIILI